METDPRLPGSVLVDLYLRLRDEVDGGELCLDPNHKLRAGIVMAILSAAETIADVNTLEAQVRAMLGRAPIAPAPEPLAA